MTVWNAKKRSYRDDWSKNWSKNLSPIGAYLSIVSLYYAAYCANAITKRLSSNPHHCNAHNPKLRAHQRTQGTVLCALPPLDFGLAGDPLVLGTQEPDSRPYNPRCSARASAPGDHPRGRRRRPRAACYLTLTFRATALLVAAL